MDLRFRRVKVGCYIFGVTMAILINLSPVLFLTLRERYGISYTALASLITVNFVTQLLVDLLSDSGGVYFPPFPVPQRKNSEFLSCIKPLAMRYYSQKPTKRRLCHVSDQQFHRQ